MEQPAPNEAEARIAALVSEWRREVRRRRAWTYVILGGILGGAFLAANVFFRFSDLNPAAYETVAPFVMIGVFCSPLLGVPLLFPWRKERAAMYALAQCDDLSAIGPLLEMMGYATDARTRAKIAALLISLLPRLKASDAHRLTERHKALLSSVRMPDPFMLKRLTYLTDLVIAEFKALEQVGDSRALPYVEQWTKIKARTEAQKRIQAAARECLPYLQERAAKERNRETLLRAAQAPAAPPETLLRAAQGALETDPHTLLRASAPGERPT